MDLTRILFEAGAVAHSVPVPTMAGMAPRTLTVATRADWIESCERARHTLSIGAGRLEPGWTWEEGIARWGARYLRRGVLVGNALEEAMGRPEDADAWAAEMPAWIDAVYEIAARGSAHVALELGPNGETIERRTGLVLTAGGMVPLETVPREPR